MTWWVVYLLLKLSLNSLRLKEWEATMQQDSCFLLTLSLNSLRLKLWGYNVTVKSISTGDLLQNCLSVEIKGVNMEPKTVVKEKYFILTRGKSRKGFCRGCIGRVEAETQSGELLGVLYSGGSNVGSPKSGGIVPREDTYPLTRHQAQLLLFISSFSKRVELLCNPQLFSAICELTQDDLVVVKHKKGHMPGLVRNLMQIGRKENKDDLYMLGFEVEFVVSKVDDLKVWTSWIKQLQHMICPKVVIALDAAAMQSPVICR